MTHWIAELVSALILGSFAILFPYKPATAKTPINFAELKRKYQKWELFSLVPLFIFWPLLTWLFGLMFQALAKFSVDDNPRIKYQLFIDTDMWYIPAFFLAFALIYYPIVLVYKSIFTEVEFEEYTLFTNLKHGYDGMKVFKPMSWAAGLIAIVTVFLMDDYYLKIWNFKIEENAFLTTQVKEYNFKQIKKITYVEYSRSGEKGNVLNQNPHYHILYNDGNLWDTSKGLNDRRHQREIISFLSSRTNVHVDTLGVDPTVNFK